MNILDKILSNEPFISDLEKIHIQLIIDNIKDPYKGIVEFDLASKTMFDTRKINRQTLIDSIQQIIIKLIDEKANKVKINTKGAFLSNYEAKILKRKYFIKEVINTNDDKIKHFINDLNNKITQF